MNTETLAPAPASAEPRPLAPLPRTRKQIQAAEMSEQSDVRARWKSMLPLAQTTWPKVPQEELALVKGNVHKLAGMVQMRYRIGREEADLQVKAFLAQTP